MINTVQLGGSLKDDPDLVDARGGSLRADFTVVVNNVRYDRSLGSPMLEPVFIRCVAWEDTAEVVARLGKGAVVLVTGQLTQQETTGRDGTKERKTKVQALTVQVVRTPPADRAVESTAGDDSYPGW